MKIRKIVVFSLVLGTMLTMASVIRYEREAVPDLDMIRYGFPFHWLFHQTASIAGSVDIWSVQWSILVIDFVFWYIISTTIVFVWNKYKTKRVQLREKIEHMILV